MNEVLYSVLVGTAGLGIAALIALFLTVTRRAGASEPVAQRRLVRLIAVTIVLQGLHFTEGQLSLSWDQRESMC